MIPLHPHRQAVNPSEHTSISIIYPQTEVQEMKSPAGVLGRGAPAFPVLRPPYAFIIFMTGLATTVARRMQMMVSGIR